MLDLICLKFVCLFFVFFILLDVLRSVTDLFEGRYEGSLRRADRTIMEQIDLIQVAILFSVLWSIHKSQQIFFSMPWRF